MAKEFLFHGKKLEEIQKMSFSDFVKLLPARERRSLKRGLTEQEKILMENVKKGETNIKTHCRDIIILPEMIGKRIKIHNGKEWVDVFMTMEMLGHRLGEFALTRRKVAHSAPGIGATRSSASLSVR